MKTKITQLLSLLLILTFTNCQVEEETIKIQSRATSQKISVVQLLAEIDNVKLKEHLNDKFGKELGLSKFKNKIDNKASGMKIIKKDGYITYSFLLNRYSKSNPYFKYFIVTKEGDKEKAGYAIFTPDSPVIFFDEKHFTGILQVQDLQNNLKGETHFVDSVPNTANNNSKTSSKVRSCTTSYSIITHNCSNGGNHSPGTSCEGGSVNDGYYEIIYSTYCTPNIEYISEPGNFMGGNGGGGNSITFDENVLKFIYTLTDEEYAIVVANPSMITYLTENGTSPESVEFAKQVIWMLLLNPDKYKSSVPIIISKQIDDSQLDPCPKGIMEQLKNATNADIASILGKLGANSIYTVTMEMGATDVGYAKTQRISMDNYSIKVDRDRYTNSTQLFKAAALVHELIHAYYLSVVDDNNTPTTNLSLNNFSALYQAYEEKKYPGGVTVAQHDQMAKDYVDSMALALQEYYSNNSTIPYSNPSYEVFTDLAWGTLQEASIFKEKYKDGDPAKERILNRYKCESIGSAVASGTPSVQYPIGKPCN